MTMENNKTAFDYSIRLLSKRDYSKFKLRQKLSQKNYDELEIEDAIKSLEEKKLLREEEYLRIRVKTLLLNGHANRAILRRLESEELYPTDEFIDLIRTEYQLETNDVIASLIEKKMRSKTVPQDFESKMKLQNKLLNFLISKGHDYHDVKNRVEDYFNERACS